MKVEESMSKGLKESFGEEGRLYTIISMPKARNWYTSEWLKREYIT